MTTSQALEYIGFHRCEEFLLFPLFFLDGLPFLIGGQLQGFSPLGLSRYDMIIVRPSSLGIDGRPPDLLLFLFCGFLIFPGSRPVLRLAVGRLRRPLVVMVMSSCIIITAATRGKQMRHIVLQWDEKAAVPRQLSVMGWSWEKILMRPRRKIELS